MATGGGGYTAAASPTPNTAGSGELVLEVYSNSTKAWAVGIVCGSADGIVTVRFLDAAGQKRQKAAYRQDPMFANFGTHSGDKLPPGCVKVPSTTRQGQFSYFDQAAGRKFATPELAWHAFLEQKLVTDEKNAKENKGKGGDSGNTPTPAQVPTVLNGPKPGGGPPTVDKVEVPAPDARRKAELDTWVSAYVQQPVLVTPGINYLNQIAINFDRCTELFAQEAKANAPHRARLVAAIENGSFMRTCAEAFLRRDPQARNYLQWSTGAIRDYVVGIFQNLGLVPPSEAAIGKMFSAFDVNKQNMLGMHECILLVDAIARSVFRADAQTGAPGNEVRQQATSSSASPDGPTVPAAALGTQAAASPFLAMLAGLGRRDSSSQDAPARPHVYSTLSDHGRRMPATEVRGFGVVDGAMPLARILCQRAPTSVHHGGPHSEEVRQRLQAKAAAMIAAQQANQAAAGLVTVPPVWQGI